MPHNFGGTFRDGSLIIIITDNHNAWRKRKKKAFKNIKQFYRVSPSPQLKELRDLAIYSFSQIVSEEMVVEKLNYSVLNFIFREVSNELIM